MNVVLAIAAAYLIGTIPTAIWVSRAMGHDLRKEGSGNPGTANALGVAGPRVAASVLALDVVKGAAAVAVGRSLGGDAVGLVAAWMVILGQIANVWLGFRGGKGLGVGLGAIIALWPLGALILLPILGLGAKLARSAAKGALIVLAATAAVAATWAGAGLSNPWGVTATWSLFVWALTLIPLIAPKFVVDLRRDRAAESAPGPVAPAR